MRTGEIISRHTHTHTYLNFAKRITERANKLKVAHRRQEEPRGMRSEVGMRLLTALTFELCNCITYF